MVEQRTHHARRPPAARVLEKVKALRKAGLRAEHVAFSFMKRMV
jgi:hypothetical protein